MIERVKAKAERFKRPVIVCMGLTFKANIDDMRESPSLEITQDLLAADIGIVKACDPNVEADKSPVPLVDIRTALQEADILVLLVDHAEFIEIDRELIKDKVVIDTRGIWR